MYFALTYGDWIHLVDFSAKEDIFCDFLFALLHI